jgi:hypothetical protein
MPPLGGIVMGLMSEYISRRLSASDLEAELIRLIKEYNIRRETFAIVYAVAIGKQIPDISLNQEDYYTIYDLLKGVDSQKLDMYLETPGGSAEAAEDIVKFLHTKFKEICFVVTGEAKSAGTIMVLSGDEILMTDTGSLGPIDAQVKIGRSVISAHDYKEWADNKMKEAEKNKRLNPFDATMVAQISPGELMGVNHALKYAEELVSEWLVKYKFKNWTETETRKLPVTKEMKGDCAKRIAGELTNHSKWRTHGRSIKAADLQNIGLRITTINSTSDLGDIVYRIQTVCRLLLGSTSTYKIFATEKEKVFKTASPTGTQPMRIPPQIVQAEVAEFEVKCQRCGKSFNLYAKFVPKENIDGDFNKKGVIAYPKDNRLKCDCGFEIDLSGIRNELELKVGKKIIT